jgi:hypothetical protein
VLDVACGGGKACLGPPFETIGVDIDGAPLESALGYGYKTVLTYSPPNFKIALDAKVDAVTAIALNAHIPFTTLEAILRGALGTLKPSGHLLVLAELDNDGLSYRLMRALSPDGFSFLVNAMAHYHLENEASFVQRFRTAFPDLELVAREPLVGSLVGFQQPFVAAFRRDLRTPLEHATALGCDVLAGLVNRVETSIWDSVGGCFLVAYLFRAGPQVHASSGGPTDARYPAAT